MTFNIYKLLSFLYLILLSVGLLVPLDSIFVTSIIDQENQPTNLFSFFLHFILFFFLFLIFSLHYKKYLYLLIFFLLYSIIIELLQIITGRSFQLLDIIFNVIGLITAYIYVKQILKI